MVNRRDAVLFKVVDFAWHPQMGLNPLIENLTFFWCHGLLWASGEV